MDGTESKVTEVEYDIVDTNLPAIMAGLETLTVNTPSALKNKRVCRKIIPQTDSNENLNRRCSLRPRKRTCSEMEYNNQKVENQEIKETDVKDYYLNKNLKRKLNCLETIFEEKDDTNESTIYMGAKRYKRMIQFQEKPSTSKLKKRKAKVKKAFGSKINFKQRRASMQMLLDKLNSIKTESPAKIDSEIK